jgi:redox-sensitive bicupin YhaK (pirin superfamily)
MISSRQVRKIVTGRRTVDGAGVNLVRVIGPGDTDEFDPFLMLDAFDSTDPDDYIRGFPWHPHRGIETVTYLISGDIEHGDSLGNKGSIFDGDCQWMTAGSGILHQEMPQASGRMLGAQLWLNLPAKDKMTVPSYGDIRKADVPVIEENGNRIHVIAGTYKETAGAFEGKYIKATYLDVELVPDAVWEFSGEKNETLFVYIFAGSGTVAENGSVISEKQAVLFTEGELLRIGSSGSGMRFILLSGKPLKEPVAWGGPIVMNTQDELDQAFDELEKGTFIRKAPLP